MAGPSGVNITGAGSVAVSAANTYSGPTAVQSGTLVALDSQAVPSGGLLSIGANGSLVLGAPGAVEPLGLGPPAGAPSGAADSGAPGSASGSAGAMDAAAAPVASAAVAGAGTVATVPTAVSALATETSAPVMPSNSTVAAADGAGVNGLADAPSFIGSASRQSLPVARTVSMIAAGGSAAGGGAGMALPPVASQSGAVAVSTAAALTTAPLFRLPPVRQHCRPPGSGSP